VNAKDNEGDTALIDASANGYVSIVRALIAAKADVNIVRNDGATALSVSLKNEHTDVADLLKKAGAHE
jgi:ankyrin repeat protein